MGRFVKIILVIVALVVVSKGVQKLFGVSTDSIANKEVSKLAADLNRQLPRNIDPSTTLTKVEFDGKVWRNSYEFAPEVRLDPGQSTVYQSRAATQICGSDMKIVLKQNIAIEYVYLYSTSEGKQELRLTIPPNSCS